MTYETIFKLSRGAFMEALNFNQNGKGRRIKTVDFIHAANRLVTHLAFEEANYHISADLKPIICNR
ncbi:hypothetical protein SMATCC274_41620 [Serratia marcescens]|nr:hypothetical protein SMATCC274_41620 [Serratia marcescens]